MTDGPGPARAGWYPDPESSGQDRWWDGHSWSATRRPSEPPHLTPTVIPAPSRSPRPDPYARSGASGAGGGSRFTGPRATPWGGRSTSGGGSPIGTANPNTLATVGFVMALLGVVVSVFGLVSLAGAVVSLFALPRARRLAAAGSARTGRGLAIAGAVIGGLSFFGWMLIWLIVGLTALLPALTGAS